MLKQPTALVTGAAGFIGSHLCRSLISEGWHVVALDLSPPPSTLNVHHYSQGDVCDSALIASLSSRFAPFDIVFHLAAQSGVRHCERNPNEAERTNVLGTATLLENLRDTHVVVASSSSVYGRQPIPWGEDLGFDEQLPVYARSKALSERVCGGFAGPSLRVTICRFFTVYGPNGRVNMAVQSFLSRLNSDRALRLFGDGSATRDFTFVGDIVASLLACHGRLGGALEVVNIGHGSPESLWDLISAMESILCKRPRVLQLPPLPEDVPATHALVGRAASLGLPRCDMSLRQGLEITLRHHMKTCPVTVAALLATTPGREEMLQQRALSSIARQSRRPEVVVVVLDFPAGDHSSARLIEALEHRNKVEWKLNLRCILNSRTPRSASGAWNSGLIWMLSHLNPHETMVAVLDDDDEWLPHHVEQCMDKVRSLPGADVVVSGLIRCTETGQRPQSAPATLRAENFLVTNPHLQGSNLFIRFSCLLRAGLFDEALPSCTDRDLMIRVLDLGDVRVRSCQLDERPHSVLHYAESNRLRLSTSGSEAKLTGLSRFWAKYHSRMSDEERTAFTERAASLFGWKRPEEAQLHLSSATSAPFADKTACAYTGPVLVGVISDSSSGRVAGLLSDLLTLKALLPRVDVLVLENGPRDPQKTLEATVREWQQRGVSCSLITLEQQHAESSLFPSWIRDGHCGIRRSIAEMRTLLQLFCWAMVQSLPSGCLVWLLDDDKRIDERCLIGFAAARRGSLDAVLGVDSDTPPLPAACMTRTQLVDVVHCAKGGRGAPVIDSHDYYHDLAANQFVHLEMPVALPAGKSIDAALRDISRGLESTRPPSPPLQEALWSDVRGGCALVINHAMLVDVAVGSPAMDNYRFTRRSDMIWAAQNRLQFGRCCLMLPSFVVSHHRQADAWPLDRTSVIQTLVDDILGSAVYRTVAETDDFVHFATQRLLHAKASIFRISGLLDSLESAGTPVPASLMELRHLYELEYWQEQLDGVLAKLPEFQKRMVEWRTREWRPSPSALTSLKQVGEKLFDFHRRLNAKPAGIRDPVYVGHGAEGVVWQVSPELVCKVFDRGLAPTTAAQLRLLCFSKEQRQCFTCLNLPISLEGTVLTSPYLPNAAPFPGHLTSHDAAVGLIELVLQCRDLNIVCNNLAPANVLVCAEESAPKLVDWGRDIVPWTAKGEDLMLRRAFIMLKWGHREDLKLLMRKSRQDPLQIGELSGFCYLQQALNEARSQPSLPTEIVDLSIARSLQEALSLLNSETVSCCVPNEAFIDAGPFRLTKLLRAARMIVESRHDIPNVRLSNLLPSSDKEVLMLRPPCKRDLTVAIVIRTCAMEYRSLYPSVIHKLSQLEGTRELADERILLIDSRTSNFLRAYNDGDMQLLRQAADQLLREGWIDRVVDMPEDVRELYHDWFSDKCRWTRSHTAEGHTVAMGLQSLLLSSCDLILQLDSDVMIGRKHDHDLLREAANIFQRDASIVSWSVNVYHLGNRTLPITSPHRIDSRASFFHVARLRSALPLTLPADELQSIGPSVGWQRLLDQGLSQNGLRSVRGGSTAIFYVHPPNILKQPTRVRDWGYIMGALEAGALPPSSQAGRSDLNILERRDIESWVRTSLHPRAEPLVIVICGWEGVDPSEALACLQSLQSQSFDKWGAIAIVDGGSPGFEPRRNWLRRTLSADHRVTVLQPRFRAGSLSNTWLAVRSFISNPETIVVTLDLDDMLASDVVLEKLRRMYQEEPDLEVAVGGMVRTDRTNPEPLPLHFDGVRSLRGGGNVWQHLRSFRKRLFDRISWSDISNEDVPFPLACDWAFMLPIVEMSRCSRAITFPSLLYRAPNKSKESRVDRERLIDHIAQQAPYARSRPTVAVVGHTRFPAGERGDSLRNLSVAVGKALAEAGFDVVTGGLGGVMEAVARGVQLARSEGSRCIGLAIGFLPGSDKNDSNPFIDIAVPTSLEHARNAIVAQSEAMVVIGGGAGTMSEVSLAWSGRRLIVAIVGSGGTADKVAGTRLDDRIRYSSLPDDCVYGVASVDALLDLLKRLLPLYSHRRGIQSRL